MEKVSEGCEITLSIPARIGVQRLSVFVSTKSKLSGTTNMNFSLPRWVSDRVQSPPALLANALF